MAAIVNRITRERALLLAVAVAVLAAFEAGEFTWDQAPILIAGAVIRFFVTPSNEVDDLTEAAAEAGYATGAGDALDRVIEELKRHDDTGLPNALSEFE